MEKYLCKICGYVYDPAIGDEEAGIKPGISWEDLPADWLCPVCAAKQEDFVGLEYEKYLDPFNDPIPVKGE